MTDRTGHVSWLMQMRASPSGRPSSFALKRLATANTTRLLFRAAAIALLATVVGSSADAQPRSGNPLVRLWSQGTPAFGVFVPNESPTPRQATVYTRAGAEKLANNPLYDFVFLNLEGSYDAPAVKAVVEGLRPPKGVGRKALLVRIPPISADGAAAAKARVKEALELGADGVTIPHVRSVEEAKQAIVFFQDAKANVWSPANPGGDTIAMLMIEDPDALAQADAIADLPGYSVLACGIGSLTRALGGNRDAGEAGTQKVLAATKRARLPNMLTATTQDVEKRVKEGFLGILAQGQSPDVAITIGRTVAGRRQTASVNQQPRPGRAEHAATDRDARPGLDRRSSPSGPRRQWRRSGRR